MPEAVRRQPKRSGPRTATSPNPARSTSITRAATRPNPPRTKVLLVRQPIKSVRPTSGGDRLPVRLAIGTIAAVGVVTAVWLIGHLGYQLGFAPIMNLPQLSDRPTGAMTTGTLMLLWVPRLVFAAASERPEWLMLAFAMIAIPAAGLGAAKPRRLGGARPVPVVATFAALGAAAAILSTAALIWWAASPPRQALLRHLPLAPQQAGQWLEDLQVVAGLDILALLVAGLWVVLVMRLPVPTWLRALAATFTIFAAGVSLVAMSVSTAAAALVHVDRSICLHETDASLDGQLLLGSTQHRHALLHVDNSVTLVELTSEPQHLTIIGAQSIAEYLTSQVPEE